MAPNPAAKAIAPVCPTTTNAHDAVATLCTSLDPHELPDLDDPLWLQTPPLRADDVSLNFRHRGWANTRQRVWQAMLEAGLTDQRLTRFAQCGQNAWLYRSDSDETVLRIFSNVCRDRFCLPCARLRARVISNNILANLPQSGTRFVTLTLNSKSHDLPTQLKRITKAFSRLRRTRLWRGAVTGGVGFIELKPSASGPGWNVHLHIVTVGRYLAQGLLSAEWKRITGDSYIVDVRFCGNSRKVTHYVTTYVTKPFDHKLTRDPARLVEAIRALASKRLLLPFGSWAKMRLTSIETTTTWVKVCSLSYFVELLRLRDDFAVWVAESYFLDPDDRPPARSPPVSPEWLFDYENDTAQTAELLKPALLETTPPRTRPTDCTPPLPWEPDFRTEYAAWDAAHPAPPEQSPNIPPTTSR